LPLLRLVCPVVSGSLDCPFLIATSVFSVGHGIKYGSYNTCVMFNYFWFCDIYK
jgi:hypothetical protein